MARAEDILGAVKISVVWRALGGGELRRNRGRAWWRNGDGWNVFLDDIKGRWSDYARHEGGGIIDFVILIRGGSRQDALRWLSELVGVALDDRPMSSTDRQNWARERAVIERELPTARLWRRAAVALGSELLETLTAELNNPATSAQANVGEIADLTRRLNHWRCRLDPDRPRDREDLKSPAAQLVDEYGVWRESDPGLTAAMVRAGRKWGQVDRSALAAWLSAMEVIAA